MYCFLKYIKFEDMSIASQPFLGCKSKFIMVHKSFSYTLVGNIFLETMRLLRLNPLPYSEL